MNIDNEAKNTRQMKTYASSSKRTVKASSPSSHSVVNLLLDKPSVIDLTNSNCHNVDTSDNINFFSSVFTHKDTKQLFYSEIDGEMIINLKLLEKINLKSIEFISVNKFNISKIMIYASEIDFTDLEGGQMVPLYIAENIDDNSPYIIKNLPGSKFSRINSVSLYISSNGDEEVGISNIYLHGVHSVDYHYT